MQMYCVKCRKKQNVSDEKEVVWKNGRRAVEAKCTVCGTKTAQIKGKA